MYFGMIRPQKKQQQKRMQMMDQLKKGDKVILVDGLHGKVDSINDKDNTVVIDADGIYLTFSRMAIRQVLPNGEVQTEKKEVEGEATETKSETETKPEENSSSAESDTESENSETKDSEEN